MDINSFVEMMIHRHKYIEGGTKNQNWDRYRASDFSTKEFKCEWNLEGVLHMLEACLDYPRFALLKFDRGSMMATKAASTSSQNYHLIRNGLALLLATWLPRGTHRFVRTLTCSAGSDSIGGSVPFCFTSPKRRIMRALSIKDCFLAALVNITVAVEGIDVGVSSHRSPTDMDTFQIVR